MTVGVISILVPKSQTCPVCEGRGLLVEPPAHGVTLWTGSEKFLLPFSCDCCGDRGKVSVLRRWRWKDSPRPAPPVYLRGDASLFKVERQKRIEGMQQEAIRGVTGWPPVGTTSRPDLIPLIAQAIDDDDHNIRYIAVMLLVAMNHEATLVPLTHALESKDSEVRAKACFGLSCLGRSALLKDSVVPLLKTACDRLMSDPLEARYPAAVALYRLGELHTAEPFVENLSRYHEEPEVVAGALADFNRKDAILGLIKQMAAIPGEHLKFFGAALRRLTGESIRDDPVAWYRWFERHEDQLPPQHR